MSCCFLSIPRPFYSIEVAGPVSDRSYLLFASAINFVVGDERSTIFVADDVQDTGGQQECCVSTHTVYRVAMNSSSCVEYSTQAATCSTQRSLASATTALDIQRLKDEEASLKRA